jgi:hypothetical protein
MLPLSRRVGSCSNSSSSSSGSSGNSSASYDQHAGAQQAAVIELLNLAAGDQAHSMVPNSLVVKHVSVPSVRLPAAVRSVTSSPLAMAILV